MITAIAMHVSDTSLLHARRLFESMNIFVLNRCYLCTEQNHLVWSCNLLHPVLQDVCSLHPLGATHSVDRILEALQSLELQHSTPTQPQQPFDLGSLVAAVQPLQQQEQPRNRTTAPQQLHGGLLVPLANNSSSSSSRASEPQQQQRLRVVLVYCRSRLPAPVWRSHRQAGLAVDCLHVHDKPQPGEQQQQLQVGDAYS